METKELEAMAKEWVNNHSKFSSFSWYEAPKDKENWCLITTSHRDSGILEKSNEVAILERMSQFIENGETELHSFSHWLVGHEDSIAVRVYNPDKTITNAFKEMCKIQKDLENYPVLDEDHYRTEYAKATIKNVKEVVRQVSESIFEEDGYDITEVLPIEEVSKEVYYWISTNQPDLLDESPNGDYPSEDAVKDAIRSIWNTDKRKTK